MSDDPFIKLLNHPVWVAKQEEAERYLTRHIFAGLHDLRPCFDAAAIKHFCADDFRIVIHRCTQHNILVIGVEVFTSKADLVTVKIVADGVRSNDWCHELVDRFSGLPDLSFCATYDCDRAVQ